MRKMLSCKLEECHYHAEACIVWCFDDRFSCALNELSNYSKFKNYDLVKVAGGAKALTTDKQFVLDQINISIRLHNTKRVILMNHSDCGAYGGLKSFDNDKDKEKKFHENELKNAKKFLEDNLSQDIKVEAVFVDFDSIYIV